MRFNKKAPFFCYINKFLEEELMERKYLGMDKSVCFGLCYIFVIISIILIASDKELDKDEKRMCVDTFVLWGISVISGVFSIIPIVGGIITSVVGLLIFVFSIIAAVKRFQGDFAWKVPVVSDISASIIK